MDKATIVVVEDEALVALDLEQTLLRLGYHVPATAASGAAALALIEQARPDLVLMDIRLDGDMDGIETAHHIRNRFDVPVIYLTAYSDDATLRRTQMTAPYGYIIKPFNERELYVTTETALYRHMMERKLRRMERWLATTLASIGDAVIATDTTCCVTFLNPIAEVLTGWTQADAIGRPVSEIFVIVHETTRVSVTSPIEQALREGMIVGLPEQTVLIARDGTEMPIDDSAAPIRDDDHRITGAVLVFRDISGRRKIEQQLHYLAMHDTLTGLANRTLVHDRLTQALARCRRAPQYQCAVLYIDIDRFKIINDSLGHGIGDQLLIAIARRLEYCIRAGDTVGRLGGDEFIILVEQARDISDAVHVARRVLDALSLPIRIADHDIVVGGSIGIAASSSAEPSPDTLMRDADIALYRAKHDGKGRYAIFDAAMHDEVAAQLQLEMDLRQALARGELHLHYQPIIELATLRLCGFEALVRWQHPTRGSIEPSVFIPVLEETGLIIPVGTWILREACTQLHHWHTRFPQARALTMSVNISGKQMIHPAFAELIATVLHSTGLEGAHLCLEMTESMLMDVDHVLPVLHHIREQGVTIQVDDFGTGYSSLSRLHALPVDALKIDRAFVQLAPSDVRFGITQSIVVLGQVLGLRTIAEGLESDAQIRAIQALGCGYGQGYAMARPSDAETTERWIGETYLSPGQ